jgi:hypothetical protein
MKKGAFACILIILLSWSCQKQEVKLPLIPIAGITEIQNHSSIWIFYKEQNADTLAILNKNNKILNTHWIFNIDKRLKMKHVIPHLRALQENRNKDSMHKKEGMLNYFSYADTALNQISLTPFDPVTFVEDAVDFENEQKGSDNICLVDVEILNSALKVNEKIIDLTDLKSSLELLEGCDSLTGPVIRLKYNHNTEYQDYLETKVYLSSHSIPTVQKEYIFTVK